jgi:hypothetical protein
MNDLARRLAIAQGAYWGATGIWPIVHLGSFELVTGPKASGWLVKTVGLLIGAVGATLLLAGARGRVTEEIAFLGATSAATLGGAGGWYAARGRIRRIYLADAVLEAATVAGWAVAWRRGRGEDARPRAAPSRRLPVGGREAVPEL